MDTPKTVRASPRRGLSHCAQCGKEIPPNKRQNKFCDRTCSARFNNKGVTRHGNKRGSVLCLRCGQPILNRGKRYCSLRCASTRRADETEQRILGGISGGGRIAAGTLRAYLIKTRGERCEMCGWDKKHPVTGGCPLEVDHIDGDATNHRLDNLRLLCPNCHALTPTFRNLNKGNGRAYRRKAPP
ncbi:MAG: DUF2116 family Zn-ribbon domain-containing protein [Armatimonadetes bacterium]|nr:DUF2116 family Zn-ribbon domain-containing protein [Armatimonadota bacterium]